MAISKKKTKLRACIFLNWSIRRFKRSILNIHVSGGLINQMLYYYILIRDDSIILSNITSRGPQVVEYTETISKKM